MLVVSGHRARWVVVVLLLVMFAQMILGARRLSLTSDEPSHIAAGITYLVTGSLWIPPIHGHPPFVNALSALPLLLQPERPLFQSLPGWEIDFSTYVRAIWPRLGPIERVAFVTRLPIMLMALLLAVFVFRWAREVFGYSAGVLSVVLMAFDPNMIAHAQLNTTDLGVTFLGFTALYMTWRVATRRTPNRWAGILGAGVLLGLAMAAKGSGVLYFPPMLGVLIWGYLPVWRACYSRYSLTCFIGQVFAISVAAFLALWAIYHFQVGTLPGSRFVVPFPAHFALWRQILSDVNRIAFLRGETKVGGWWWYFLYSTAIKTPIPLLIGVATAIIVWLRSRQYWWKTFPLLVFPILYWATAISSKMNIGHRHLLPTFPFIYIFVGLLTHLDVWRKRAAGRTKALEAELLLTLLLGWYIVDSILIYPFYLAYFNQFVGGPRYGYKHLVDSNVDWGQSFIALREWMERNKIEKVRLSYYTYVDPAVYGVRYEPLPPAIGVSESVISRFAPQPAVYAISATPLQGVMAAPMDLYDWFRHQQPDAQVGYGLLIYDVRPEDVAVGWLAQCTVPVVPLPPEEVFRGEGKEVRMAYFDCTQAWLYPEGGEKPGHYALARDESVLNHPFVQSRLRLTSLAYEQRLPGILPAFVLYAYFGKSLVPLDDMSFWAAPSDWAPAQAQSEGVSIISPVSLEGPLEFLGAVVEIPSHPRGTGINMDTYWRVIALPKGRPLSIMAHLLTDDGNLVSGDDGLGVPIDYWQCGDIIVQHHVFTLPSGTSPDSYWLETGVYWLDTMERWAVVQNGHVVGDRLLIREVSVGQ